MRILILLLVLAGACTRTETSEPETQAENQAAEPAAEEATKAAEEAAPEQPPEAPPGIEAPVDVESPPTVELVDAGQEPKKALRTTFEAGAKQSLRVKADWTISTIYGPMLAVESTMPSLTYELETEVKESTAAGTRFALRVKKISVEAGEKVKPAQVEAVKKSVPSLEGAKGAFSIDARGMVGELTLDVPADAPLIVHDMVDQLEQAVRLCSLPLPEEPVGKGATWTASQVIDQRTAQIRQTTAYTLANVRGNEVEATSKHEGAAPEQSIKMPGSRSGTTFSLNEVEFSGEGKGTWRLDRLGPSSATEETLSVLKMMVRKPREEAVVMGVGTTLEIEAKP
jgi:hypothetical protein